MHSVTHRIFNFIAKGDKFPINCLVKHGFHVLLLPFRYIWKIIFGKFCQKEANQNEACMLTTEVNTEWNKYDEKTMSIVGEKHHLF